MNLQPLRGKPWRLIVGLMSGTSADGIDAVLCRIKGTGKDTEVQELHMSSSPYPDAIRQALVERPWDLRAEEVARLNFALGELFAASALKCIEEAGMTPAGIDLISSHGQTIAHFPGTGHAGKTWRDIPGTLQIGDLSVIAKRTGILTVGDFRPGDMALGGQGAPLVPYVDWALFSNPSKGVILQNIGGIANLTYLRPGANIDDVVAFDTGPGNMAVDILAEITTNGRLKMDEDAGLACQGELDTGLLERLLEEPYYRLAPPKSTGRELFGPDYVDRILLLSKPSSESAYHDVIRTVSEITVRTIVDSYRTWVFPRGPVHEVIVTGGGAHNPYFMRRLEEELPGIKVFTGDSAGMASQSKEALAFAVLGNELVCGGPNNVPGATGAARRTVLGKIALPS